MLIELVKPTDFERIAHFIAGINKRPKTFCLHCGETTEAILKDIKDIHSRKELRMFKVVGKKGIRAVFGGECSTDEKRFWLWGPFIKSEKKWIKIADKLYVFFWKQFPNIEKLYTYNHEENTRAHSFFLAKNFIPKASKIFLYELITSNFKQIEINRSNIIEYTKDYFNALDKIHNRLFPNTYYTTSEMVALKTIENKLWIIPDGEEALVGYILASLESEGGFIHFVGISKTERKKGYATALMQKAINWLVNDKQVNKVHLTVVETNNAKYLYSKLGFSLLYTGKAAKLVLNE